MTDARMSERKREREGEGRSEREERPAGSVPGERDPGRYNVCC